jgi:hypothetical protein
MYYLSATWLLVLATAQASSAALSQTGTIEPPLLVVRDDVPGRSTCR